VNFLCVFEQLDVVPESVDDVESVADVAADQDVVADAVNRSRSVVSYESWKGKKLQIANYGQTNR
jgi:hypothetical protein